MEVIKITSPDGPLTKIAIRSKCETALFNLSELMYCKAERNYTCFYFTDNRKCIGCYCLADITTKLESYCFKQVNKSFLVNLLFIRTMSAGKKYTITLTEGTEIAATIPKKEIFD